MPAVADALRDITITGLFYCPSFVHAPFGGTLPPMPGCVWFHVVTSGRGDLVVGGERLELQPGDLALVPHGTGHRIEVGEPEEFPLIPELPHDVLSDNYAVLRCGDDGPLTELVCGGLRLEHPNARRLIDALPPVVHVRSVRRSVLGATLDLLAEETQRRAVGSEAVISRLCDIVVIQAIRSWLTSDEAAGTPWLRAMSDPQLGPALAALHAEPGAAWTIGKLAALATMSRSAFAARFRERLDQPVMAYLTELRMQMALDLLHRGERNVTEVATAVGYESDSSFSRAFKRHVGTSPRRASRAS
jgi:AraC-like DNA-binding protein